MRRLLLLLVLLAPLAAPGAQAIARNAEARYSLALGVEAGPDEACRPGQLVVDAACFEVYPKESHVTLAVDDATGRSVAVKYAFKGAQGRVLATGHFCGSAGALPIPGGARTLVLVMGDGGEMEPKALPGCQLQRGTGGVVNAVFR